MEILRRVARGTLAAAATEAAAPVADSLTAVAADDAVLTTFDEADTPALAALRRLRVLRSGIGKRRARGRATPCQLAAHAIELVGWAV